MDRLVTLALSLLMVAFIVAGLFTYPPTTLRTPTLSVPIGPLHVPVFPALKLSLPPSLKTQRDEARAQAEALRLAEQAAARRASAVASHQVAVTTAAASSETAAQERIRVVYRTITEKVPQYVTPAADARCIVPIGFVRGFDAAAKGAPDVPGPSAAAGQSDDAASGVELSTVLGVTVSDFGAANANAEQLSALQDWVRKELATGR